MSRTSYWVGKIVGALPAVNFGMGLDDHGGRILAHQMPYKSPGACKTRAASLIRIMITLREQSDATSTVPCGNPIPLLDAKPLILQGRQTRFGPWQNHMDLVRQVRRDANLPQQVLETQGAIVDTRGEDHVARGKQREEDGTQSWTMSLGLPRSFFLIPYTFMSTVLGSCISCAMGRNSPTYIW